jgi:hypothetical protein
MEARYGLNVTLTEKALYSNLLCHWKSEFFLHKFTQPIIVRR